MPSEAGHGRVNMDAVTVAGFGAEWQRFDQSDLDEAEAQAHFDKYFSLVPLETLAPGATAMDVGCGSGRWSRLVAPSVGTLHLVDASGDALDVARRNLAGATNCIFHEASVDSLPVADGSMDFVYSLGVLHHVPDTAAGIRECARKLKPGAPLLLYLYYAFDSRPRWFRTLWRATDVMRRKVSRLPFRPRRVVADVIALVVYLPLAKASWLAERLHRDPGSIPLSFYRNASFYTMRTDALDRFGTQLEQRFTCDQISRMLTDAGLVDIRFREGEPFWCVTGTRPRPSDTA